jgi:hypothetical protein
MELLFSIIKKERMHHDIIWQYGVDIYYRVDYFNGNNLCYYEVFWRKREYIHSNSRCAYWHGNLYDRVLLPWSGTAGGIHSGNRVVAGIADAVLNRMD